MRCRNILCLRNLNVPPFMNKESHSFYVLLSPIPYHLLHQSKRRETGAPEDIEIKLDHDSKSLQDRTVGLRYEAFLSETNPSKRCYIFFVGITFRKREFVFSVVTEVDHMMIPVT